MGGWVEYELKVFLMGAWSYVTTEYIDIVLYEENTYFRLLEILCNLVL